jgi:hypothetical protein
MPPLLAVQALIDAPEKMWGMNENQLGAILAAADFTENKYGGGSLAFTWERKFGGGIASFTLNYGGGIHDQGRKEVIPNLADLKNASGSRIDQNKVPGAVHQFPPAPTHKVQPFYYKIEFKPYLKLPIKVVGRDYSDPRTQGWDIRRI